MRDGVNRCGVAWDARGGERHMCRAVQFFISPLHRDFLPPIRDLLPAGVGSTTCRLQLHFFLRARRSAKVSQGIIKKLTDKGFGFIEGERGDIFFHHTAV